MLLTICLVGWFLIVFHPFVMIDGIADAIAWLDENGDGEKDPNEPPLADVCIWDEAMTPGIPTADDRSRVCTNLFYHTDDTGNWPNSDDFEWIFRPGADCNDVYIFAAPPVGYQATTPLVVNECRAEFGFAPDNVQPQNRVLGYAEQMQKYRVIKWLKNISIFAVIVLAAGGISTIFVRPKREKLT